MRCHCVHGVPYTSTRGQELINNESRLEMSATENPPDEISDMEQQSFGEHVSGETPQSHEPGFSGFQAVPQPRNPLEYDHALQATYAEKHYHLQEYYDHILEVTSSLSSI